MFTPTAPFLQRSTLPSLLCLCVSLLVFHPSFVPLRAQEASTSVQGRIQDPTSGDYLANARVVHVESGREALTDSTGFYQLAGLKSGSATLRVTYLNFDPVTAQLALAPGQSATRDFALTNKTRYGTDSATVTLSTFVVAGSRQEEAAGIAIAEQRYAQTQKKVLAADAFGEISENNVGEFLKRMPGVTVNYAEGDAASITLRGFGDIHTSLLIDGMSVASGGSSNPTRLIDLENVAVANTSRLEVIKTVLPNQWANSLGGSVNLVSKSSFERTRPLLDARLGVQFTNDDHSFGSSPGPAWRSSRKIRPGGGFSYINPLRQNLGLTVSANYSDQFGRRTESQTNYEFTAGAATGGSERNPFLRSLRLSDNARNTVREAYSIGVDWRPQERLTLNFNYQHNALDLFSAPRFVTLNTGATPTSSSATGTVGRAGAGTVEWGSTATHKMTGTDLLSLRNFYRGQYWKLEGAATYSYTDVRYRNLDDGFFRGITLRVPTPTVNFREASGSGTIVGSSRVDLQACKLEYSIVSPK